jgi:hypothetical protein
MSPRSKLRTVDCRFLEQPLRTGSLDLDLATSENCIKGVALFTAHANLQSNKQLWHVAVVPTIALRPGVVRRFPVYRLLDCLKGLSICRSLHVNLLFALMTTVTSAAFIASVDYATYTGSSNLIIISSIDDNGHK